MCATTMPAQSAVTSAVTPTALDHKQWHALESHDISRVLKVDPKVGLTPAEVNERQLRYGPNALRLMQSRPAWRVLVDQFASIVIVLLAIAAVISWATGDGAEAIAILIVLILNAAVGFATEWQAGRPLDALGRQSHTLTRVRRNAFESTVEADELVPGDIVVLNEGYRVPADARLLDAVRLEANCRSRRRSAADGILKNPFIWIAAIIVVMLQLLAAYLPPLAAVLGVVKPSATDWIVIGGCGLLLIRIVEVTKFAFRQQNKQRFSFTAERESLR